MLSIDLKQTLLLVVIPITVTVLSSFGMTGILNKVLQQSHGIRTALAMDVGDGNSFLSAGITISKYPANSGMRLTILFYQPPIPGRNMKYLVAAVTKQTQSFPSRLQVVRQSIVLLSQSPGQRATIRGLLPFGARSAPRRQVQATGQRCQRLMIMLIGLVR